MFSKKAKENRNTSNPQQQQMQQPQPTPGLKINNKSQQDKKVKQLVSLTTALVIISIFSIGFAVVSSFTAASEKSKLEKNTQNTIVAVSDIKSGQTISKGNLTVVKVPGNVRVKGAYTDYKKIINKVALTDIPVNTQITSSLLADLENKSTLANSIPSGYCAVTISITQESGMDSMLQTGDKVKLVGFNKSGTKQSLVVLSNNAEIITTGTGLTKNAAAKAATYATITVKVTQAEASRIRLAQFNGDITTILLPSVDKD